MSYLLCVSLVTASNALHRMSRDLSMSPTQEGKRELAASSKDDPVKPVEAMRDELRGLSDCGWSRSGWVSECVCSEE